jgi:hypothetical protein
MSPSQSRCLHTGQHKHRLNAHRHLCLKWDSNPWPPVYESAKTFRGKFTLLLRHPAIHNTDTEKASLNIPRKSNIILNLWRKFTGHSVYRFMNSKGSDSIKLRWESKSKLIAVLNKLSTVAWRRMGQWIYRSTFSWPPAIAGDEWSASRPARFTPREIASCYHWIGGWVDPQSRSGRRGEEKILDRTATRTPTPR